MRFPYLLIKLQGDGRQMRVQSELGYHSEPFALLAPLASLGDLRLRSEDLRLSLKGRLGEASGGPMAYSRQDMRAALADKGLSPAVPPPDPSPLSLRSGIYDCAQGDKKPRPETGAFVKY